MCMACFYRPNIISYYKINICSAIITDHQIFNIDVMDYRVDTSIRNCKPSIIIIVFI